MKIEKVVVGGGRIDFEVASMNHHAQRSVNCQRDAVDQTVRYRNWMNGEYACLEALISAHLPQVGIVEQSVLVEFVFHISQRELGAPHRHVEFGEHPWQGSNVVFVAVRQNNSANA